MADFRFLRDGGEYTDPETGESKHFEGHLFDEVVFNDSVAEFWSKKQQLADYFDENQDEDIYATSRRKRPIRFSRPAGWCP